MVGPNSTKAQFLLEFEAVTFEILVVKPKVVCVVSSDGHPVLPGYSFVCVFRRQCRLTSEVHQQVVEKVIGEVVHVQD